MAEESEKPKRKRYPRVTEEEKQRRERLMAGLNSMRGDNPPLTYHALSLRLARALKKIEEDERLKAQGIRPPRSLWSAQSEDMKSLMISHYRRRWKTMTPEEKGEAIAKDPEALEAAGLWPEQPTATPKKRRAKEPKSP